MKEELSVTSGGECDLPTAGFQAPESINPRSKRISRPDADVYSQPKMVIVFSLHCLFQAPRSLKKP